MLKYKKLLIALVSVVMVALLTLFGPRTLKYDFIALLTSKVETHATLEQDIVGVRLVPDYVFSVYYKDDIIGVLQDLDRIDDLLAKVYETQYAEEFPDSSVNFSEDITITKELSFFEYEDIDEKILNYIADNNYFAIKVPKVVISNGAEFYVKSIADFEEARDTYVMNFISQDAYNNIQNNIEIPTLETYGTQDVNISIQESIEVTEGYASYDEIKKNVEEIIYYLSYGDNTEMEYYTVQKYDTVEGIASKYGLDASHIVMINANLSSTHDILVEGDTLNVTYYNSPLTIVVTKQRMYSEVVYPASTKYIYDSSIAEGLRSTVQSEKEGKADVIMSEVYINGVLQSDQATLISSTITEAPVQEIIRVGTRVIPGVGTGSFRWPVDNPYITCRWYCYSGHQAIDIQNRYNNWGSIYAADRGVVIENSYHYINGYYVRINHNNGYVTYYGHMRYKSSVYVGQKVDKGQWIGAIGMTGYATGPHVHFAIEKNGTRVNPCRYLGC